MRSNTLQLKRAVSAVLFVLLLSAVGMTKAFAQSFTVGYLNYSVNDDGATVTVTGHVNGTGATGELVIPETVTYNESTYSVTTIGTDAFLQCSRLTGNLVIPNSVTTIEEWAFRDCEGFNGNLTIGNSVTTIGDFAFCFCWGFTGNLVIPNSVTTIGEFAFSECSGFTGDLVIPNSLTTISEYAFWNCNGFTGNLVIPNSVTTIEAFAFSGCGGFTGNLVIPNSVTTIGYGAFSDCGGFTGNLVIPNSLDTIFAQAFCNCTGFSSVEYNATNCADVQLWDEYAPFYFCTGQLIIGESVERIPANMFKWSAFSQILSHAEMPPTVGTDAFYGIDHDILVYVPCGSLSDYQNSEGWNEFNNIFNTCLEITALVIPANSGTVTGTGTYEMGTTCTLTAIANEGYTFLYWIENETVVSTDATYSFVVIEDRNLVAGFIVPGSLGDVNDDHVVNVADVQAVASYMYGYYLPTFNVINADANQDGKIDIGDIQAILMIIQNYQPD